MKLLTDKCSGVSIATLRWHTSWLRRPDPAVSFGVEHSEIIMIFLAIVSTKDIQLFVKKCGRMILDLRRLNHLAIIQLLMLLDASVLQRLQTI